MMRLATRSGLASVARLMARGFLGGFGNCWLPTPRSSRAVFHISVKGGQAGDRRRRGLRNRWCPFCSE